MVSCKAESSHRKEYFHEWGKCLSLSAWTDDNGVKRERIDVNPQNAVQKANRRIIIQRYHLHLHFSVSYRLSTWVRVRQPRRYRRKMFTRYCAYGAVKEKCGIFPHQKIRETVVIGFKEANKAGSESHKYIYVWGYDTCSYEVIFTRRPRELFGKKLNRPTVSYEFTTALVHNVIQSLTFVVTTSFLVFYHVEVARTRKWLFLWRVSLDKSWQKWNDTFIIVDWSHTQFFSRSLKKAVQEREISTSSPPRNFILYWVGL